MGKKRDWYTYEYTVRGNVKHGGRTQDLEERKEAHQKKWPGGHIHQRGEAKTKEGAIEWEKKHGYS